MNKYVEFIEDDDFEDVVTELIEKYESVKEEYTLEDFFKNRVDPIKFVFDQAMFGQDDEAKISAEISRKIDKKINNFIGTFHERLLGKIDGVKNFPVGSGYDIKTEDDSIYAEIKNKFNTVKGSNAKDLYRELVSYVNNSSNPEAKAYYVHMIAQKSYNEQWKIPKHKLDDKRIFKISGDKFYELLTDNPNAFAEVCVALPLVIENVLKKMNIKDNAKNTDVLTELVYKSNNNNVDLMTEIFNENFENYLGFPIKNNN